MSEISGVHEQHGHINTWDVSNIEDMSELFKDKNLFNENLDQWDVSNVVNFSEMFQGCSNFNQNLPWKINTTGTRLVYMGSMFSMCSNFNGNNIHTWNVGHVSDMSNMFEKCFHFNQPLQDWDVSKVRSMEKMFSYCTSFNQPLENWVVTKVKNMRKMFENCTSFNQPLRWDVKQVTNMNQMFANCTSFNQDLAWNLNHDLYYSKMFFNCNSRIIFDEDCENEEDPISLDKIPLERGFRLEADFISHADLTPHDGRGRCYDADNLLHIENNISPMTRKPFTMKDKRRLEQYNRLKKHT